MTVKRIIFYILSAFIAGTLILVYIQYNSSKNVRALIDGNKKYLEEYKINSKLKTLEKDVGMIESNLSDVVATGDSEYLRGMKERMRKVESDLMALQEVSGDDSTEKEIDRLESVVRNKMDFSRELLDSFYNRGKLSAEKLIGTLKGKRLMDSIYLIAQNIENARHSVVTRLNDVNVKSGEKVQRLDIILITIVLICGAALFWYVIFILQKLIQSEKKEKEAARIKENFMANMSHEIRTPMNAILGFTNLLQRRKLDGESMLYVQTIQKSGENLLSIINDILDLSKLEAGMVRIESAPFSIRGLLHSVEVMLKPKAVEKQLQLSVEVADSMPDILEGDATRLTQILVNLVGNALKFTDSGSVLISIASEGISGNIVHTGIQVKDTGVGVEEEKLKHIFERFQQAEDSITRKYGGTGLGLSIVRDLVLLQHGTIDVQSEPGKGTTFKLVIPYKISLDAVVDKPLQENTVVNLNNFENICVLVAEDNEINQNLVRHLFQDWGLKFDMAGNGVEAIEKLKQKKYDLVLMDIQMPEMDGYSATQEIRNTLKLQTPIIAMTAHALAGEREKCLSYGMNEYISKPIREAQLHMLIGHFIQLKRKNTHLHEPVPGVPNKNGDYSYINLEYMKEVSGGDAAYERTVTEQFIEAIPDDLRALEKNWEDNHIKDIRQLAHNMKTTVSVMGLNEILQPYLDALEYENIDEQSFQQQFGSIRNICEGAIVEAKLFLSKISD